MDSSSVGTPSSPRVFPTRRQATAHAKAAILKSDINQRLEEQQGGFVWHVEKWPHWVQVSVDMLGNAEAEEKPAEDNIKAWYTKEREEAVKEMFTDLLGPDFGEIYVVARPMGQDAPNGACCRTGCGGCMNGTRDKLLPKLQGPRHPDPVDRMEFGSLDPAGYLA